MVKQKIISSLALLKHWLSLNVLEIPMIAAPHPIQVRCRSADWEESHRKEDYCLSYINYSSPEILD